MIRVMENPVLLITESKDQEIDRQLAKSIGAGAVVQQSRGTPIIDELWHGTISPSELAKADLQSENVHAHMRRFQQNPGKYPGGKDQAIAIGISQAKEGESEPLPAKKKETKKALDDLLNLLKSADKDEDDVGGEDPAKEEADDKGGIEDDKKDKKGEASESVKSFAKSADKDEDDVGGEDPAKEEMDDKAGIEDDKKDAKGEASESVKSEVEFFINLVKGDDPAAEAIKETEGDQGEDEEDKEDKGNSEALQMANEANDNDDSEKSVSSALDDLIKGEKKGEGSRGGHIIGHTRSGKPIYDSAKHPDHKGFSSEDHYDATKAHARVRHQILNDAAEKNGITKMGGGNPDTEQYRVNVDKGQSDKMEHHSKQIKEHIKQINKEGGKHHFDHLEMTGGYAHPKPYEPDQKDFDHQDRLDDIAQGHRKSKGWDTPEGKAHAAALDAGKEYKPDWRKSLSKGVKSNAGGAPAPVVKPAPTADFKPVKVEDPENKAETKPLIKGTPMGVPEIKVDEYGIPLYEGVAFEVHDDADKNTVRELIDAGLVGDPEHAIDKRIPQLISRLGMIY